jgi:hypothetical protein
MGVGIEEGGLLSAPKATEGVKKMRRIVTMVALSVALLAVSAGAVFAANQIIRCAGQPCVATGNDDLVYERAGNRLNDTIYLKGGDDQVRAGGYTNDQDRIYGSSGFDLIYVSDGDRHDRIGAGRATTSATWTPALRWWGAARW